LIWTEKPKKIKYFSSVKKKTFTNILPI